MNDDDLTTDLGRALHDHSDAMRGSSLALADVKGKARSIRRRRAATAVGGAVVAVALIVPTAAIASHQGHRTTPMPPATQSITPSPSPTASDDAQPLTGVLDVSDLPTGAAPAVDYLQDGTFHVADGSTFAVGTRHTPSSSWSWPTGRSSGGLSTPVARPTSRSVTPTAPTTARSASPPT